MKRAQWINKSVIIKHTNWCDRNVFILSSLLLMLDDRERERLNPWMWLEIWVPNVYFFFYEYCLMHLHVRTEQPEI